MPATIHDNSLRTHYTWGSHREKTRKLLIAPGHTRWPGSRHTEGHPMRASAFDPPSIPPAFWDRPQVIAALRKRDMGALFILLRDYAGLSQTRIGTATELGQGRVSEIVHGTRAIAATHVFERIAHGLAMPDQARLLLGLSPRHSQPAPRQAAPRAPGPARTPTCSGRSPPPAA
jgi:hypothetical protein